MSEALKVAVKALERLAEFEPMEVTKQHFAEHLCNNDFHKRKPPEFLYNDEYSDCPDCGSLWWDQAHGNETTDIFYLINGIARKALRDIAAANKEVTQQGST